MFNFCVSLDNDLHYYAGYKYSEYYSLLDMCLHGKSRNSVKVRVAHMSPGP